MTIATVAQLDKLNQTTMHLSVRGYSNRSYLEPAEQSALQCVAEEVRGKRILDLGVGGGRTVRGLLNLSENYLGIDYVEKMTEACRSLYPTARFETMDARSMPSLADNSFELIVFSCNGLCMVDHEGRMAILKEVYRLLTPGGIFIFSAYNRNSKEHDSFFTFPAFRRPSNPIMFPVRVASHAYHTSVSVFNRLRYKRWEIYTNDYSIINDKCHNYRTMLYYTTMAQQLKQLESIGFSSNIRIFNTLGVEVRAEDNERCDSLLYLARR